MNAGSVENHSGHIFSPAADMGFWTAFSADPTPEMRKRAYDDVKYIEVPNADPILAYRTVLWIQHNGYRAFLRNCEDDVYDVLRAYGVSNLTPPSLVWFPKSWFRRFRGSLVHVSDFAWDGHGASEPPAPAALDGLQPWHPTWRRAWHFDFHLFGWKRLLGRA